MPTTRKRTTKAKQAPETSEKQTLEQAKTPDVENVKPDDAKSANQVQDEVSEANIEDWAFTNIDTEDKGPHYEPLPVNFSISGNQYKEDDTADIKEEVPATTQDDTEEDPKADQDDTKQCCDCQNKGDMKNLEEAVSDLADSFGIPIDKVADALKQIASSQKAERENVEDVSPEEPGEEQAEEKTDTESTPEQDVYKPFVAEGNKDEEKVVAPPYRKYLVGTAIVAALLGTICSTTYCISNMSSRLRSMENEMYVLKCTVTDTKDTISKLDEDLTTFIDNATIYVASDDEAMDGTEAEENRGYLGIKVMTVTDEMHELYGFPYGAYIAEVTAGGASEDHLYAGDVITAVNDAQISTAEEIVEAVGNYKIGEKVKLTVQRQAKGEYSEKKVKIELGENPETLDDIESPVEEDVVDDNDSETGEDNATSKPTQEESEEE